MSVGSQPTFFDVFFSFCVFLIFLEDGCHFLGGSNYN